MHKIILVLSFALALVWGMSGSKVLLYLIIALLAIGIIFEKQENKFIYLGAILPWHVPLGVKYFGILEIVFLVTILISAIRNKKKIHIVLVICAIGLSIYTILSLFASGSNMHDAIYYFYPSSLIILSYIFVGFRKFNFRSIMVIFAFSTIIASFVSMLGNTFPLLVSYSEYYNTDNYSISNVINQSGYARFSGLDSDANFYAYNVLMCITGLGVLNYHSNNKKEKIFYIFLTVVLSILGFMSFSNTYIITWIFFIVVYYLFATDSKHKIKGILFTLIILMLLQIVFTNILNFLNNGYNVRFTKLLNLSSGGTGMGDTLTDGRFTIWYTYLSDWAGNFSSILFGKGNMAIEETTAHNTFIRYLYMFGITGVIAAFILLFLYSKIRTKYQKRNYNIVHYLPLIIFLIFNLFLDGYRSNSISYFGFYFFLIYECIYYSSFSLLKKSETNQINNGIKMP